MSRHEQPPFRMTIEGGRMVPASQYDAERLDSYRRGTKVNVRITEDKDRILVRKWWAVLGLVVKQCETPWRNKDEASEAIKLALGIVNLTKTVGGQFMSYPKSLTELSEPEISEALEQMMDLLHRMTGVDPETLRKEAADVGADEESDEPETPDPDTDSSPASDQPGEVPPPDPSPGANSPDKELLIRVFRALYAASGPDREIVEAQSDMFADEFKTANKITQAKAKTILKQIQMLGAGEIEEGECIEYLAGIIGVEPTELFDNAANS